MDVVGWIVVGFFAGALSGAVVERGPRGCLANTVVGILGGILGGWFATEQLHYGQTRGFIGALVGRVSWRRRDPLHPGRHR
jgi:uncharacterized membrane protein YeaQ/YmgE (transglycosylase-associated protein family)